MKYPPFCDIILFAINSADKEEVEKASNKLYRILEKNNNNLMSIFNAVPAPIDKIKNCYRWRIIAKCKLNSKVIDMVNNSLEEFYKCKFKKTKISINTNPNNMS